MSEDRIRVIHLLPHAAGGGATLQAMLLAERLDSSRYEAKLVVGPDDRGEGNMLAEMRERELRVIVVPYLRRDPDLRHDARAVLELARLFQRERPRIIHTHGSKPRLLAPPATALSRGALAPPPLLVAHLWGWEWQVASDLPRRALYTASAQLTAHGYHALIACSEAMRRQGIARAVGRPDDYHVLHPAVELDSFRPEAASHARREVREELGLPADAPVVISVTRLAAQKAPEVLLRTAALLAPLRPDLRWIIVGGGPLQERVREMIAELDLNNRVLLTGPRRDIPRLLAASDLFALSSAWEPFGIVNVEAAAMGLPVICTAVDGTPEAVAHDQNGLLVAAQSPVALAGAIARLLSDGDLARRMGEAGRGHALRFSPERFVRGVERVYERLLAEESSAR